MMRSAIRALTLALALLAAPAALAAPTCRDGNGDTIRCGALGAMPVGWSPSPQQLLDRQSSKPADLTLNELTALIYIVVALFTIIALMPEFDGSQASDWDEQEGDRQARR
jgi:hypothetical protein